MLVYAGTCIDVAQARRGSKGGCGRGDDLGRHGGLAGPGRKGRGVKTSNGRDDQREGDEKGGTREGRGDWRYERRFVIDIWALAKSGCGFEYWTTSDCTDDDGSMFAVVNSFFSLFFFLSSLPLRRPQK